MDEGIIRPDKNYRKRVFSLYVVLVLIGVVFMGWVLPWSKAYTEQLDPENALRTMKFTLVVVFLSIIPIAIYILTLGRKMVKHERFPPPGMKVLRETLVIKGARARLRGRVLVVLSLVLIFLALLGALYIPYMIDKVSIEKDKLSRSKYSMKSTPISELRWDRDARTGPLDLSL